ncbi:uncharacterized protein LOC118898835 [Balaenoptera musculus]|uniref:Uncharacterized protein LOC118898835 n=1 Tax=Balaenoptera musculus TaxID=9771 RepID=A0A8B8XZF9_BALMU|nr:uncharacterized protein LOC118898835 [Balaenoptera musculus]
MWMGQEESRRPGCRAMNNGPERRWTCPWAPGVAVERRRESQTDQDSKQIITTRYAGETTVVDAYNGRFFLATQRNKVLPRATTWRMNPGNIMLSERSQTQKTTSCVYAPKAVCGDSCTTLPQLHLPQHPQPLDRTAQRACRGLGAVPLRDLTESKTDMVSASGRQRRNEKTAGHKPLNEPGLEASSSHPLGVLAYHSHIPNKPSAFLLPKGN